MSNNEQKGFTTHEVARRVGGTDVILESRSFGLPAPFGGFVWNRPVAARVRTAGGEERLPIEDVTRRGQMALYGLSLLLILIGLMIGGRSRKE